MRIGLVISEVNYMPDNYRQLYTRLCQENPRIKLVVVIKNANFMLLLKGISLIFMGAPRIGFSLIKNYLSNLILINHTKFFSSYSIKVIKSKNINSPDTLKELSNFKIDLLINLRTRCIYKSKILKIPTYGCFNLHHGILPEQRGTFCDLWAIFENKNSGFSLHKMDAKIDNGPIIYKKTMPKTMESEKNYFRYLQQCIPEEAKLIGDFLKKSKEEFSVLHFEENKNKNFNYYRNPTYSDLKKMRGKGMKL